MENDLLTTKNVLIAIVIISLIGIFLLNASSFTIFLGVVFGACSLRLLQEFGYLKN